MTACRVRPPKGALTSGSDLQRVRPERHCHTGAPGARGNSATGPTESSEDSPSLCVCVCLPCRSPVFCRLTPPSLRRYGRARKAPRARTPTAVLRRYGVTASKQVMSSRVFCVAGGRQLSLKQWVASGPAMWRGRSRKTSKSHAICATRHHAAGAIDGPRCTSRFLVLHHHIDHTRVPDRETTLVVTLTKRQDVHYLNSEVTWPAACRS